MKKKPLNASIHGTLFLCFIFLGLSLISSHASDPKIAAETLIHYLNNPRYAAAVRYDLKDNTGNHMQCLSVIDMTGQAYKYAAVYHTPYLVTGGYRYKVNLAISNDLMNWIWQRTLLDNADMPKFMKVTNGEWIILTHEQWMNEGPGGDSRGPAQLGFKLFHNYADLLNGTIRKSWVAGQHVTNLNGTPNFYDARIVYDGLNPSVEAICGFHFWDGYRDAVGHATVTKLFHPGGGTSWSPMTATNYNNLFINAGVTGNIGQRATLSTSNGRYTIQEGNVGDPASSWDKWRVWLYSHDDDQLYPTGNGSILQLAPQTHKGSSSFGNPNLDLVKDPNGIGQAIVVSYFIFGEGSAPGEAGSLLYYFPVTSQSYDHDNDGMSDYWQSVYTIKSGDKFSDLDGDGQYNFEEAEAGTNPRNRNDFSGITDLKLDINVDTCTATWRSVQMRYYEVERSTDLITWVPVITKYGEPNKIVTSATFPFPRGGYNLFYRVRGLPEYDYDYDGDGLQSWEEQLIGTDPFKKDTDNNGMTDGFDYWLKSMKLWIQPNSPW
jgi:hypothetical protein